MVALSQCLHSRRAGSTIACFELSSARRLNIVFDRITDISDFLQSLTRGTAVNDVSIEKCYILRLQEQGIEGPEDHGRKVIESLRPLTALRLSGCNLLHSMLFARALASVLGGQESEESQLQCLEFQFGGRRYLSQLQIIVAAIGMSTALTQLGMHNIPHTEGYFQEALNAIESFRGNALSLSLWDGRRGPCKTRNVYSLRSSTITVSRACISSFATTIAGLSQRARVDWKSFCSETESSLAGKAHPALVPVEELPCAIALALEAGSMFDALHQRCVIRLIGRAFP